MTSILVTVEDHEIDELKGYVLKWGIGHAALFSLKTIPTPSFVKKELGRDEKIQ